MLYQPNLLGGIMSEIRMTVEARTDYDCETNGLPAERWGESVFKIGDEEIVFEISVEEKVTISMMVGEDAMWKGTLDGLKDLLKRELIKK